MPEEMEKCCGANPKFEKNEISWDYKPPISGHGGSANIAATTAFNSERSARLSSNIHHAIRPKIIAAARNGQAGNAG